MRLLFVTGGSPATVFAITPLATAARNAGHEVVVATNRETMEAVAGAGLAGYCVSETPIRTHIFHDRQGHPVPPSDDPTERMLSIGNGFGRMAAAYQQPLWELAERWRPDVVVGGALHYSAAVLSARLGVPYARLTWDLGEPLAVDGRAEQEMAPELEALGLPGLPPCDLFVDVCPVSVRDPEALDGVSMRWIPWNTQDELQPWMIARGDRPRVVVTAGTKVAAPDYFFDYLVDLVRGLRAMDVELLVSVPPTAAADIERAAGVPARWMPLDVIARSADLFVHHGGGGTALAAMVCGVPQLIVPNMPKLVGPARRLAAYGAARTIETGDAPDARAMLDGAGELLNNPGYRQRAGALAEEIAAMPTPSEVVGFIEKLP